MTEANANLNLGNTMANGKRAYIHQGELQNFLFAETSLLNIPYNVKRLILLNQEKALGLERTRNKAIGYRNFKVPLFNERQILLNEWTPMNGRAVVIFIEMKDEVRNNSLESKIDLSIVAITDIQDSRPVSGEAGMFYLSAMRSMFLTYPGREFLWRPLDAEDSETAHAYALWWNSLPQPLLSMGWARLDSGTFGDSQLGGQLALTLSLEYEAGLS